MPGLRSHPIGTQPTNLLINGKGTIINVSNLNSVRGRNANHIAHKHI